MINIQVTVDNEYCREKMETLGITVKDIAKETGLNYNAIYQYLGDTEFGKTKLTKMMKVAMFYYFKSKEV